MVAERQILLVEDEAPVRDVWQRFLARWGYSHDIAATGDEALHLAQDTRYQVLITDLAMPGLSGQELIHTLQARQPELEFIVVTGYGTVEVAVEVMKAGAYDFITKPINFIHAELVVKNCLHQLSAKRETLRLRRLAADLEALNELKEKFIAITNHELRTPVGVIQSVVEVLEDELNGGEQGLLVSMLSRSAAQLTEIVNQMHEISEVKSDRLQLTPTRFALPALCKEVVAECWLALQKRELELHCEIGDKLLITADRAKLKKVVRELVHNAIKFTHDGGRIVIDAGLDGDRRLVLSVSDTGVGIAPEHHDRIFELFYEVGDALHHHTSSDQFLGGGMGVGLSIVNDIVAAHHGTVEVASAAGEGSRFTVVLPQDATALLADGP